MMRITIPMTSDAFTFTIDTRLGTTRTARIEIYANGHAEGIMTARELEMLAYAAKAAARVLAGHSAEQGG